jgi:hypothetical protein
MKCLARCGSKLVVVITLLLLSAGYSYAQSDEGCSNANLKGGFGFVISGINLPTGPFALMGRFVADGEGNLTGTGTEQAVFGAFRNVPFAATYTVNADCTGSATLTFTTSENHGQAHLDFVLVDGGREVIIIDSDRGSIETGSAKKQFPKSRRRESDED